MRISRLIFSYILVNPDLYEPILVDENHIIFGDKASIFPDQVLKCFQAFVGDDDCLGGADFYLFQTNKLLTQNVVVVPFLPGFVEGEQITHFLGLAFFEVGEGVVVEGVGVEEEEGMLLGVADVLEEVAGGEEVGLEAVPVLGGEDGLGG